jgi:hypothetical protein
LDGSLKRKIDDGDDDDDTDDSFHKMVEIIQFNSVLYY